MKIAISLIYHNDSEYLIPCLQSLFESDIKTEELKLFCYDNSSTPTAKEILDNFNINYWLHRSDQNDGIVLPRIRIYNEIVNEDFDYLLEIHSDMLFPKNWFHRLIEIDDDDTVIIQPHIFLPKTMIELHQFESILDNLYYEKVYNKCVQVHPWLIKIKLIDQIGGYYDPNYSPQECEDDDFVYRVLINNKKIKSTGKSWVVHYGGVTRHKVLPSHLNKNMKYFCNKFSVSFNSFKRMFEYHPYKMG